MLLHICLQSQVIRLSWAVEDYLCRWFNFEKSCRYCLMIGKVQLKVNLGKTNVMVSGVGDVKVVSGVDCIWYK